MYKNKQCLEFYYHMWGDSRATLNIVTKSSTDVLSLPLWSRSKNYGDRWNFGQVTIPSSNVVYQIGFEGIIGNGTFTFEGDIAIDDVKIEEKECEPEGFCNFESNDQILCSWEIIKSKFKILIKMNIIILNIRNFSDKDGFEWLIGGQGTSGALGLGPSVDHTLGKTGHYLYIDNTKKQGNQVKDFCVIKDNKIIKSS